MKPFRPWLLFLALLPAAFAQPQPEPAAPPASTQSQPAARKQEFFGPVFSLLPKSLQKNPRFEMTVVTEMTEEGKKLPVVSPEMPAYYVLHSAGFRQMGDAPNEKTLGAEDMERILVQALTANGYRRASPPAQPPSLLIIYVWGSHNQTDHTIGGGAPSSPIEVRRNLLDRAALVGGEKFARKIQQMLLDLDDLLGANTSHVTVFTPEQLELMSPIRQFRNIDPKNDFLVEQTDNELYYVVASAYDYGSVAKHERKLLWRTRMTVDSSGVSQTQTLPTLITSAAPFFGKEMAEPEVFQKRAREGRVEIGTPTVVDDNAAPKPAGAAKPKAP